MLLVALVGAGLMLAAPVADGAFVGTFVAADATSLVVRAEDGQQGTFVVDAATSLPPGFVAGTRILVRFEATENGQYRAASVSPPHIPLEADVMTTLPAPPGPPIAASPLALTDRALPRARVVPAASSGRNATSREGTAVPSLTAVAPREPLAQSKQERLRDAPTPPVPPFAHLAQGNTPHLASDWPLVLLAFLGSFALLGWGMHSYR